MPKINFQSLNRADREAIFKETASAMGMTPFAVEKDWWVSRTLNIIFQMDIASHLVFKGGTSLSKAWQLISRLSEDIDLAIDRSFFSGYEGDISRTQISKLRKEAGVYTTGIFFEDLLNAFKTNGFKDLSINVNDNGDSDQDPRIIEIYYPNIISQPSDYVLPKVQVEISCRSLREPFTNRSICSLVDDNFADRDFVEPAFTVQSVNPERTFLEKLFLLHEEFRRPEGKMRVDRLSRHM